MYMYVNVSDYATFIAQENETLSEINVRYLQEGYFYWIFRCSLTSNLCTFSPSYEKYRDRISVRVGNVSEGMQDINFTISDIRPDDNGTYML